VPTLHITNGDSAAGTLRTFLADPVYVTCDVLHDGPAPAVDGDEWHDVRARFLAGWVEAPYDDIRRLLEEYPSTTTGLSRTAEAILRAIESRPLDALTVFQTIQAEEPCPFMGDWGLFDVIHEMADARVPLVTISPSTAAVDLRGHTIDVTRAGRDVLTGRSDAVALNGIDTWRGGVHLVGRDRSPWRWDPGGETLVS
jgi:hypothetical protein